MKHRSGVDVVMVSYRSPHDADAFIDSYRESRTPDSSLWVVNVDPTEYDATSMEVALADVVGEHGLITWGSNCGYARACNDAAQLGDREVVAFFNADTRLPPGLLDEICREMRLHTGWGIVGPRQVDESNRIVHGGILGDEANPRLRGWWQDDRGQFNEIDEDAVSVSGSAYFVRRCAWDELAQCPIYVDHCPDADGAFLPTPHFYEETWCSYHARAHGWRVVYYGAAHMIHRWHGASPVGGVAEREYYPTSQAMFRAACEAHRIPHD